MTQLILYDPTKSVINSGKASYKFFTGDDHLIGVAQTLVRFKEDNIDLQKAFELIKWEFNHADGKYSNN